MGYVDLWIYCVYSIYKSIRIRGFELSRHSEVKQPNIYSLARTGMRFDISYANPQCTPTRI